MAAWAKRHKKKLIGAGLLIALVLARLFGAPIPIEQMIAPVIGFIVSDDTADDAQESLGNPCDDMDDAADPAAETCDCDLDPNCDVELAEGGQ